jgi:hypothetical protein
MHERATRKVEQGLDRRLTLRLRLAIEAVLIDCILDGLSELALQLDGRDWQTIEEKHKVNRVLVVECSGQGFLDS